MVKERNGMEKEQMRIYTRERVIIFTGKTRQYLVFQLSLGPFYLQSHATLFPLFPCKMFSSSSILGVAQQFLATLPMSDSCKIILWTSLPPRILCRETCDYPCHFARGSLTASTQWVRCWKHSTRGIPTLINWAMCVKRTLPLCISRRFFCIHTQATSRSFFFPR